MEPRTVDKLRKAAKIAHFLMTLAVALGGDLLDAALGKKHVPPGHPDLDR